MAIANWNPVEVLRHLLMRLLRIFLVFVLTYGPWSIRPDDVRVHALIPLGLTIRVKVDDADADARRKKVRGKLKRNAASRKAQGEAKQLSLASVIWREKAIRRAKRLLATFLATFLAPCVGGVTLGVGAIDLAVDDGERGTVEARFESTGATVCKGGGLACHLTGFAAKARDGAGRLLACLELGWTARMEFHKPGGDISLLFRFDSPLQAVLTKEGERVLLTCPSSLPFASKVTGMDGNVQTSSPLSSKKKGTHGVPPAATKRWREAVTDALNKKRQFHRKLMIARKRKLIPFPLFSIVSLELPCALFGSPNIGLVGLNGIRLDAHFGGDGFLDSRMEIGRVSARNAMGSLVGGAFVRARETAPSMVVASGESDLSVHFASLKGLPSHPLGSAVAAALSKEGNTHHDASSDSPQTARSTTERTTAARPPLPSRGARVKALAENAALQPCFALGRVRVACTAVGQSGEGAELELTAHGDDAVVRNETVAQALARGGMPEELVSVMRLGCRVGAFIHVRGEGGTSLAHARARGSFRVPVSCPPCSDVPFSANVASDEKLFVDALALSRDIARIKDALAQMSPPPSGKRQPAARLESEEAWSLTPEGAPAELDIDLKLPKMIVTADQRELIASNVGTSVSRGTVRLSFERIEAFVGNCCGGVVCGAEAGLQQSGEADLKAGMLLADVEHLLAQKSEPSLPTAEALHDGDVDESSHNGINVSGVALRVADDVLVKAGKMTGNLRKQEFSLRVSNVALSASDRTVMALSQGFTMDVSSAKDVSAILPNLEFALEPQVVRQLSQVAAAVSGRESLEKVPSFSHCLATRVSQMTIGADRPAVEGIMRGSIPFPSGSCRLAVDDVNIVVGAPGPCVAMWLTCEGSCVGGSDVQVHLAMRSWAMNANFNDFEPLIESLNVEGRISLAGDCKRPSGFEEEPLRNVNRVQLKVSSQKPVQATVSPEFLPAFRALTGATTFGQWGVSNQTGHLLSVETEPDEHIHFVENDGFLQLWPHHLTLTASVSSWLTGHPVTQIRVQVRGLTSWSESIPLEAGGASEPVASFEDTVVRRRGGLIEVHSARTIENRLPEPLMVHLTPPPALRIDSSEFSFCHSVSPNCSYRLPVACSRPDAKITFRTHGARLYPWSEIKPMWELVSLGKRCHMVPCLAWNNSPSLRLLVGCSEEGTIRVVPEAVVQNDLPCTVHVRLKTEQGHKSRWWQMQQGELLTCPAAGREGTEPTLESEFSRIKVQVHLLGERSDAVEMEAKAATACKQESKRLMQHCLKIVDNPAEEWCHAQRRLHIDCGACLVNVLDFPIQVEETSSLDDEQQMQSKPKHMAAANGGTVFLASDVQWNAAVRICSADGNATTEFAETSPLEEGHCFALAVGERNGILVALKRVESSKNHFKVLPAALINNRQQYETMHVTHTSCGSTARALILPNEKAHLPVSLPFSRRYEWTLECQDHQQSAQTASFPLCHGGVDELVFCGTSLLRICVEDVSPAGTIATVWSATPSWAPFIVRNGASLQLAVKNNGIRVCALHPGCSSPLVRQAKWIGRRGAQLDFIVLEESGSALIEKRWLGQAKLDGLVRSQQVRLKGGMVARAVLEPMPKNGGPCVFIDVIPKADVNRRAGSLAAFKSRSSVSSTNGDWSFAVDLSPASVSVIMNGKEAVHASTECVSLSACGNHGEKPGEIWCEGRIMYTRVDCQYAEAHYPIVAESQGDDALHVAATVCLRGLGGPLPEGYAASIGPFQMSMGNIRLHLEDKLIGELMTSMEKASSVDTLEHQGSSRTDAVGDARGPAEKVWLSNATLSLPESVEVSANRLPLQIASSIKPLTGFERAFISCPTLEVRGPVVAEQLSGILRAFAVQENLKKTIRSAMRSLLSVLLAMRVLGSPGTLARSMAVQDWDHFRECTSACITSSAEALDLLMALVDRKSGAPRWAGPRPDGTSVVRAVSDAWQGSMEALLRAPLESGGMRDWLKRSAFASFGLVWRPPAAAFSLGLRRLARRIASGGGKCERGRRLRRSRPPGKPMTELPLGMSMVSSAADDVGVLWNPSESDKLLVEEAGSSEGDLVAVAKSGMAFGHAPSCWKRRKKGGWWGAPFHSLCAAWGKGNADVVVVSLDGAKQGLASIRSQVFRCGSKEGRDATLRAASSIALRPPGLNPASSGSN